MASRPIALRESRAPARSSPSRSLLASVAAAVRGSDQTFRAPAPESSARRSSKICASSKPALDFPVPPRSPCAVPAPCRRLGTNRAPAARFADASGRYIPHASPEPPAAKAPAPCRISDTRPDNPLAPQDPSDTRRHSPPLISRLAPRLCVHFRATQPAQAPHQQYPRG